MEAIKISNFTKYSLELILVESNKLAEQLLKSLSENVNKSFLIFAFYSSIFSYAFIKVVEANFLYLILVFGALVSGILIHKNLFPNVIKFNGSLPENMIVNYFEQFKGEILDKEYLAAQIESYNAAMIDNRKTIEVMGRRFIISIYCLLFSFAFFGIIFFITLIKSSDA